MLDFEFTPNITKEFLQSKYSDETYFEYYLGFPVTKKLFTSILRSDKKPTCSFYRNKNGDLIYKDFGTGDNFNFIGLVMEMFNLSYYQAINKIAADFGLIKTDIVSVKAEIKESATKIIDTGPTYIQVTTKSFSEEELDWWKKFGIEQELLDKYNVFSCQHVFINGRLSVSSTPNNYIFGYYFGTDKGRELWKIYMPLRKKFRFLNNLSVKILQGYEQLPQSGPLLVITKSMKDCASLASINIPAIAPNSEHLFISEDCLQKLKNRFKYIIIFYDNDLPGIQGMHKIKKKFPELNYFYIPRYLNVKDFSELYSFYGRSYTINLVKQYLEWLKINGKQS